MEYGFVFFILIVLLRWVYNSDPDSKPSLWIGDGQQGNFNHFSDRSDASSNFDCDSSSGNDCDCSCDGDSGGDCD